MIVLADRDGVTVAEADDFSRFHVDAAALSPHDLDDLVARSDALLPHSDAGHLWISIGFLHEQLGTTHNPERRGGLERMLAYAGTKGWVNDVGTHVAAHVENR